MVSFVVITVESFFPNGEGSLDCKGVLVFDSSSSKMCVDVIHGRYNGRNVGSPSGKKQCRIFKNLTRLSG